jgi:hypothetical protein
MPASRFSTLDPNALTCALVNRIRHWTRLVWENQPAEVLTHWQSHAIPGARLPNMGEE